MGRAVRWGIMGTGTIATDMTRVLKALPKTEVVAVGSRSAEGAERFGSAWGIERRHGSYEALAGDAGVDVVYVATPSARHVEDSLLCLGAGRHVLCEKAMAPSRAARYPAAKYRQAKAQSRQRETLSFRSNQ